MTEYKNHKGNWSIKLIRNIYALKLENEGSLWLEQDELEELREFLKDLDLPKSDPSLKMP